MTDKIKYKCVICGEENATVITAYHIMCGKLDIPIWLCKDCAVGLVESIIKKL